MFAELHIKSYYSFLTGASSPEELVSQAKKLGYSAIAITDECSYSGLVKAYQASKDCGIKLIVGSEFLINDEHDHCLKLVLLATNRSAYSEISALITKGRRRSIKGQYSLSTQDLQFGLGHCLAIWLPSSHHQDEQHLILLKNYFKKRLWVGVELLMQRGEQSHYLYCEQLSRTYNINMVACNNVHMHHKSRKPLQDTLTAIRLNTTVQKLGTLRQANAEQALKSMRLLTHQYPPALLQESLHIARLCTFCMSELRFDYPKELVPDDLTPSQYLRRITRQGELRRWPNGTPAKIRQQIEHELNIIQELAYEYYFLTVYDIVKFATSQGILCQGRGSAANSAVCYCLYITEVNPQEAELLFERFITKERKEPPDIDVDFESQRREEVIQYIYKKYSRKRTALTATVITYRRKSAVRDVGKALGLPLNFINELNQSMAWWDKIDVLVEQMQGRKMTFSNTLSQYFFYLVKEILGTPRHLSQHVGGFLITHNPTSNLVPIENAAMPDRTIIQWDKYDIETLGLLKVDVLGLGMLSAIKRSLDMINRSKNKNLTVQSIPKGDSAVYDMLCAGDSIGVFQVESRAQMSMLPRLRPRSYYDLVIEVAIVRPGPIQGGMVHPYLQNRDKNQPSLYPDDEINKVLRRTLGIPIFQEQVIKLTMVAAGFTGGEADQLRRAMASWGKNGDLTQFEDKLINGMLKKGHPKEFAERLYQQIKGFGSYGFPESHSASFALLVYFSAWLKCHYPAAFYAGILNSQPMGFYSPSQLVQDARRHNVEVRPVCINHSNWEHSLEYSNKSNKNHALRLGFQLVKGVSEGSAQQIMMGRQKKPFNSIDDFKNRHLSKPQELRKLINADAFHMFEDNRRRAYWQSLHMHDGWNTQNSQADRTSIIKAIKPIDALLADCQSSRGVSLKYHPMQLLRHLEPFKYCTKADQLRQQSSCSFIKVAGVVTGRQRPGTASGVIFMTLEDETGNMNIIIWRSLQERFKAEILTGRILYIKGSLEHENGVANIVAGYIETQDHALPMFKTRSRNFH